MLCLDRLRTRRRLGTLADAVPPSAMSGPPSSDPGQLRGAMQPHMGRYALLRKLGEGAMGWSTPPTTKSWIVASPSS